MPTDPTQAMVMKVMPIAFTFFFMIFPSGLVLYRTINNLRNAPAWLLTGSWRRQLQEEKVIEKGPWRAFFVCLMLLFQFSG